MIFFTCFSTAFHSFMLQNQATSLICTKVRKGFFFTADEKKFYSCRKHQLEALWLQGALSLPDLFLPNEELRRMICPRLHVFVAHSCRTSLVSLTVSGSLLQLHFSDNAELS